MAEEGKADSKPSAFYFTRDVKANSSINQDIVHNSTRYDGEKPLAIGFIDRGISHVGNLKDNLELCSTVMTDSTDSTESALISDTECETGSMYEETYIKIYITENLLLGDMPLNGTEIKVVDAHGFSHVTFHCDQCDAEFIIKSALAQHMSIHNSTTDMTIVIESKAKSQEGLQNSFKHYYEKSHTEEKLYKCRLYNSKLPSRDFIKYNMKSHTGDKPYKCDFCDNKFTQEAHLTNHMKIHTGGKPYECHLCDCKFKRKDYLKDHLNTHTGDKPYKCHLCNSRFIRRTYLNRHLENHTGEKLHEYHICDRTFAQKRYLLDHIKRHTSDKPFKCDFCDGKFHQRYLLNNHLKRSTCKFYYLTL